MPSTGQIWPGGSVPGFKGAWDSATTYQIGDIVYEKDKGAYVAKAVVAPSVITPSQSFSGYGTKYNDAVAGDAPTHWWKMNEVSGNYGDSGSPGAAVLANNLVVHGEPSATKDANDKSSRFDSSAPSHATSGATAWADGSDNTYEFLIKFTSATDLMNIWNGDYHATSPRRLRFQTTASGFIFVQLFNEGVTSVPTMASSKKLNDGEWHHVAVTQDYDGANTAAKMYVDGIQTGSVNIVGRVPVAASGFALGRNSSNSGGFAFSGTLQHLAVYDRVLAPSEIVEHVAAMNPPAESSTWSVLSLDISFADLVTLVSKSVWDAIAALAPNSWWKLDEASGNYNDSGSGGKTGTPVATTAIQRGLAPGVDLEGFLEHTAAAITDGGAIATFGDNYGFAGNVPFTIVLFHKPAAWSTNSRRILIKNDTTAGPVFIINATGQYAAIRAGASGGSALSSVIAKLNEWHFLAMRYNGSDTFDLFHNSKKFSVAASGNVPASVGSNLRLHGEPGNAASWGGNGGYQNLAIWNKALTDAEIMSILTAFRERR